MSNYVKTTDFAIKDGLPGGDPNKKLRGSEIDVEFEAIETAVATKADLSSPALTGTPSAPSAAASTNTTQIATTAHVKTAIALAFQGMIVLWSGSQASIPSGWVLCDGANGTPDLRDRFVVGAGTSYAVNATGGSNDAVLVSHTHTATTTLTDPGHTHTYNDAGRSAFVYGSTSGPDFNSTAAQTADNTGSATTGITAGTSLTTEGVSGTGANRPPYFALCYIMKT